MASLANFTGDDLGSDDPFDYEESDYDRYQRLLHSLSTFQRITEIVKLALVLGVIVADVYLIVVMCKDKKLKSVKRNRCITHYAIFNIFMFVSHPLYALSKHLISLPGFPRWTVYCVETQLEVTCVLLLFFCAFGLAFDWLITVRCSKVQPIYQTLNKYLILIVYSAAFVKLICDIVLCLTSHSLGMMKPVEVTSFLSILLFVLVCNCKRKFIQKSDNYSLSIANVAILCWIPLCLYTILLRIFEYAYTVRLILVVTICVPEYLASGSPIVIIIWLALTNQDFKTAFRRSCSYFKCCKSDHSSIVDNELVDNSQNNHDIEDGNSVVNNL